MSRIIKFAAWIIVFGSLGWAISAQQSLGWAVGFSAGSTAFAMYIVADLIEVKENE